MANDRKTSAAPQALQSTASSSSQSKGTREQLEKIYRESLYTLIINVLKTMSTKDNPLSVKDIIGHLLNITGQLYNTGTVRRHINDIIEIYADEDEEYLYIKNAFMYSFSGIVHEVNTSKTGNSRFKYYFEALLSDSDVNMLCAAVTSNRYFEPDEKNYLNTRLKTLSQNHDIMSSDNGKKEKASKNEDAVYYSKTMDINAKKQLELQQTTLKKAYSSSSKAPKQKLLLDIISRLDRAISSSHQVRLRYGIYNYDETRIEHLKLMDRGKDYTINPYALCWNNGSYYLVCTNKGHETPYHFRVDRILSVDILEEKSEKHPEALKKFFKGKTFEVEKYTRTHPHMSIYSSPNTVNCCFEIPAHSLSILVDYFGKDIHLEKTDREEPDYNGKMWPILRASIEKIEYPCLKLFTVQHHQVLRIIEPQILIDDLKAELTNSLNKYI